MDKSVVARLKIPKVIAATLQKGQDGTTWHTGDFQSVLSCKKGDLCFNPDTFDIYKCIKGGNADTAQWERICNINNDIKFDIDDIKNVIDVIENDIEMLKQSNSSDDSSNNMSSLDSDYLNSLAVQINGNIIWEKGGFQNGEPVVNDARIRTKDYIQYDKNISIQAPEDTQVWIRCYRYGVDKTFIYINTIFTGPNNVIKLSDYSEYQPTHFKIVAGNSNNNVIDNIDGLLQKIVICSVKKEINLVWEGGAIASADGTNASNNTRIRTVDYIPFNINTYIKASNDRTFLIYFYRKNSSGEYGYVAQQSRGWRTELNLAEYSDITADVTHFRLVARYGSSSINDEDKILATANCIETFRNGYGVRNELELIKQSIFTDNSANMSDIIEDVPKNTGVLNVLLRAKQFADVKYITKEVLPRQSSNQQTQIDNNNLSHNDVAKDTSVTGVIYSSTKSNDKTVGTSVSLDTYVTSIYNPNSIIYKERINNDSNAETYYGTVCSAFLCYCYGIPYTLTTNELNRNNIAGGITEITDVDSVQLGDFLHRSTPTGHVMLVTGIGRDVHGKIIRVDITEANTPFVHKFDLTYESYLKQFGEVSSYSYGYKLYRYNNIDSVDFVPSQYAQLFDETATYPDIITYYGDKATTLINPHKISVKNLGATPSSLHLDNGMDVDITAHVLNSNGYNSIEVYKNDVLLKTYSNSPGLIAIDEVKIENPDAGKYEFRLVGDNKTSSTHIIAVDSANECYIEYPNEENGLGETYARVHFKNTELSTLMESGTEPICVTMSGKSFENLNTFKINDEHKVNGYIDIDFNGYSKKYYLKVYFKNEFGTVAWVSENISEKYW